MNPADLHADPPGTDPSVPPVDPEERPATKFVYPSGSRPLEGYTVKRGVGRGGFGEVYFATSDAGKEVALKLIRRNLDVELRGVRQCLNLKHPNLIALYDIRSDELGDQWVVMEYVPLSTGGGHALDDAIDQHPDGMPEDLALDWMHGIAAGVAYLHDNGIVHRDLKPGNIFRDVSSGGPSAVKIGDYGLSKFISCSRRSGQTESVGTVHYMAPEIANGRYGREVDIYALGIILYEMLTGHVPFEGESVGEVLMKHLTAEPDLAAVREPYRGLIERLLAKDPDARISSVAELIDLLPRGRRVEEPTYVAAPRVPVVVGEPAGPQSPGGGADAAGPTPAAAPPRPPKQEPLWQGLTDLVAGAKQRWASWQAPPLVKGLTLFAFVVFAFTTAGGWATVMLLIVPLYLLYYLVWSAVTDESPAAPTSTATPSELARTRPYPDKREDKADRHARRQQAAQARKLRRNWREQARKEMLAKPWRQNVTELLGSMLASAILCVMASVIAVMIACAQEPDINPVPLHLWASITSTLGCWAVLLANKLTEGRFEDQVPMRMLLLALGAGIGLAAYSASGGLGLPLPAWTDVNPGDTLAGDYFGWNDFPYVAATPYLVMSVPYFALLFLMVRWWRLAEYTRDKRFSVWSVLGCMFAAWLLHIFWWYPQPAGMMVAGLVAICTQLSSPWLPPSRRLAMARGEEV